MARVTSDGQTRASTTSPLMSQTSHLRDLRQTGCDIMSVLVSQEADVLLANLAYGHDIMDLCFSYYGLIYFILSTYFASIMACPMGF